MNMKNALQHIRPTRPGGNSPEVLLTAQPEYQDLLTTKQKLMAS